MIYAPRCTGSLTIGKLETFCSLSISCLAIDPFHMSSSIPILIACCASHMDHSMRLDRFKIMIQSWATQTIKIPLCIIMSYETEELKNQAETLCNEIVRLNADLTLTLFMSKNKRPQFMHYAKLLEVLKSRIDMDQHWIMFTDDDDTWHPSRVEAYQKSLLKATSTMIFLKNVLTSCSIERGQCPDEYVHYIVKVTALEHFMQSADKDLLAHKYADMYLGRFLAFNQYTDVSGFVATSEILYNYLQPSPESKEYYPSAATRSSLDLGHRLSRKRLIRQAFEDLVVSMLARHHPMYPKLTAKAVKDQYRLKARDRFTAEQEAMIPDAFIDDFIKSDRCKCFREAPLMSIAK